MVLVLRLLIYGIITEVADKQHACGNSSIATSFKRPDGITILCLPLLEFNNNNHNHNGANENGAGIQTPALPTLSSPPSSFSSSSSSSSSSNTNNITTAKRSLTLRIAPANPNIVINNGQLENNRDRVAKLDTANVVYDENDSTGGPVGTRVEAANKENTNDNVEYEDEDEDEDEEEEEEEEGEAMDTEGEMLKQRPVKDEAEKNDKNTLGHEWKNSVRATATPARKTWSNGGGQVKNDKLSLQQSTTSTTTPSPSTSSNSGKNIWKQKQQKRSDEVEIEKADEVEEDGDEEVVNRHEKKDNPSKIIISYNNNKWNSNDANVNKQIRQQTLELDKLRNIFIGGQNDNDNNGIQDGGSPNSNEDEIEQFILIRKIKRKNNNNSKHHHNNEQANGETNENKRMAPMMIRDALQTVQIPKYANKTAMATYLNNANVNITTLANNRRDFNGGDNGNDTGCINYGSFNQQHQPQQQQHHQQQQQKNTKGNIVGKSDSKQIISANVTSVPKFTHCINHGHRTTGVQQQARPVSQHLIKTESTNINENILIPLANTNTNHQLTTDGNSVQASKDLDNKLNSKNSNTKQRKITKKKRKKKKKSKKKKKKRKKKKKKNRKRKNDNNLMETNRYERFVVEIDSLNQVNNQIDHGHSNINNNNSNSNSISYGLRKQKEKISDPKRSTKFKQQIFITVPVAEHRGNTFSNNVQTGNKINEHEVMDGNLNGQPIQPKQQPQPQNQPLQEQQKNPNKDTIGKSNNGDDVGSLNQNRKTDNIEMAHQTNKLTDNVETVVGDNFEHFLRVFNFKPSHEEFTLNGGLVEDRNAQKKDVPKHVGQQRQSGNAEQKTIVINDAGKDPDSRSTSAPPTSNGQIYSMLLNKKQQPQTSASPINDAPPTSTLNQDSIKKNGHNNNGDNMNNCICYLNNNDHHSQIQQSPAQAPQPMDKYQKYSRHNNVNNINHNNNNDNNHYRYRFGEDPEQIPQQRTNRKANTDLNGIGDNNNGRGMDSGSTLTQNKEIKSNGNNNNNNREDYKSIHVTRLIIKNKDQNSNDPKRNQNRFQKNKEFQREFKHSYEFEKKTGDEPPKEMENLINNWSNELTMLNRPATTADTNPATNNANLNHNNDNNNKGHLKNEQYFWKLVRTIQKSG